MSIYNKNQAMGMIDADLIEAAVYPSGAEAKKTKTAVFAPKPWMKWAAVAAAFVVVIAGALVALNVTGAWRSGGVADPGGSGDEHSGVIASSGSGSVGSEDGSDSTDYGTNYPPVPASDRPQTDPEPPDPSEAHGGGDHDLIFQYIDKCVGLNYVFVDYFEEKAGMDIDTWLKTVLKTTEDITNGGIFSEIAALGITKDEFIRLNKTAVEKYIINNPYSDARGRSEKEIYDDNYCYTDEEIDIIYSGDKKRIAEAFAQPFAVIADDWELYTLEWIIKNPASLYKEKHISLEAIETAVNKWLNARYIEESDERKLALLARIEEYKNMQ